MKREVFTITAWIRASHVMKFRYMSWRAAPDMYEREAGRECPASGESPPAAVGLPGAIALSAASIEAFCANEPEHGQRAGSGRAR
jgi:hypothetical protein